MTEVHLQTMLDNIQPSNLPQNWKTFDLQSFSRKKNLWDCQQTALDYAIKALWKYYRDPDLTVAERKEKLLSVVS
jgi:type III restriction enzyme